MLRERNPSGHTHGDYKKWERQVNKRRAEEMADLCDHTGWALLSTEPVNFSSLPQWAGHHSSKLTTRLRCLASPALGTTIQPTCRDLILSLPLEASVLPAGPHFWSGSPPGQQDGSDLSAYVAITWHSVANRHRFKSMAWSLESSDPLCRQSWLTQMAGFRDQVSITLKNRNDYKCLANANFTRKKKKGLGGQEEEREQGDKGAEERSPASGIPQLIILLKANKNKT